MTEAKATSASCWIGPALPFRCSPRGDFYTFAASRLPPIPKTYLQKFGGVETLKQVEKDRAKLTKQLPSFLSLQPDPETRQLAVDSDSMGHACHVWKVEDGNGSVMAHDMKLDGTVDESSKKVVAASIAEFLGRMVIEQEISTATHSLVNPKRDRMFGRETNFDAWNSMDSGAKVVRPRALCKRLQKVLSADQYAYLKPYIDLSVCMQTRDSPPSSPRRHKNASFLSSSS